MAGQCGSSSRSGMGGGRWVERIGGVISPAMNWSLPG